jgi:hypothetical protein
VTRSPLSREIPRYAAGRGATPATFAGMAKKTTKKTRAKPVADARSKDRTLGRAVRRAQRFADRIDQLDEWIDRGASLDLQKLPYRRDLCEAEYQRRLKLYGKEGAPTLAEFARHGWAMDERISLEEDLRLAARRLAVLEDFDPSQRAPIDELCRRCFGRSDHPVHRRWHGKPDSEVFRAVVAMLRKLVEAEGVGRAVVKSKRKPSPLEAAILNVLLEADGSLSAEEIAARVQRTGRKSTLSTAVNAAMGKLRRDCGFPDLYAGDAGFKLTPDQRALAVKILGK